MIPIFPSPPKVSAGDRETMFDNQSNGDKLKNMRRKGQMENSRWGRMTAFVVLTLMAAVLLSACREPGDGNVPVGFEQVDVDDSLVLQNNSKNDEVYTPILPEKAPYVSFEAPQGWEYHEQETQDGNIIDLYWDSGSSEVSNSWVHTQFYPTMIYLGDQEEAKRMAENYYGTICASPPCETVEDNPHSELLTIPLPNGINLYAAVTGRSKRGQEPYTRYSRDEGLYIWESYVFFSKSGYVFTVDFSDRPDLYVEEFDLITRTLKTEER